MEEPRLTRRAQIEWKESDDVHRPKPRPLQDFLATVRLHTTLGYGTEPHVFVHRAALEAMFNDAAVDLRRERGGVLAGESFQHDDGRYYVAITRAVPALGAEGSATHLQFTPASWEAISRALPLSDTIHGWYHTHPGLGVFMSGTDRRTQGLFFNKPWHVAVVIDPKTWEIGFFYGEKAERVTNVSVYEDVATGAAVTDAHPAPEPAAVAPTPTEATADDPVPAPRQARALPWLTTASPPWPWRTIALISAVAVLAVAAGVLLYFASPLFGRLFAWMRSLIMTGMAA